MLHILQLKLKINHNEQDMVKEIARVLGVKKEDVKSYKIVKKSIDARKKEDIKFIYSVYVELKFEKRELEKREAAIIKGSRDKNIEKAVITKYELPAMGNETLPHRPIIVGAGPAGIFAAYMLALKGYRPLLIERGMDVDRRVELIEKFWETGILDTECNVQFGEGGAGTFSDGKLNTMIKDTSGRIKKVLEIFCEHGAPEEIMFINKPHIGTDKLRNIIKAMREDIISMGGEVRFSSKLTKIETEGNRVSAVWINDTVREECDCLVLAIGHSARDTFKLLDDMKVRMQAKAFAVGVRVEHPQELISRNQYGEAYDMLPPADYKLTHQCENGRAVYSFCMCPGGFVVNASSEEGRLAINGMSNFDRGERNANSALVVTVTPEDYGGEGALAGIEFQRRLEEKAYKAGEGKIPVQLYGDLLLNKVSDRIGKTIPNTKGEYMLTNLRECIPDYILDSVIEGIQAFDRKIKGFADKDTVISGIESRTSSPVRIERDDNFVGSIEGMYPCGEGAGYAGGITSAAVDGIKAAEKIIARYKAG